LSELFFFFEVLESDGVHLTALSGYRFVRHLFDASLEALSYSRLALDLKVRTDHQVLVSQGSRLSTLEQQFDSYRQQQDLEFARQQEHNDWLENQSNENFFVISGLPNPPSKMTGGMFMSYISRDSVLFAALLLFAFIAFSDQLILSYAYGSD